MKTRMKVLQYIRKYYREHGFPAGMREILANVEKVKSTSVASYHVDALVKLGLVSKQPKISRSVIPVYPPKIRLQRKPMQRKQAEPSFMFKPMWERQEPITALGRTAQA